MYDRYLKDPTLASSNPFTSYIQLARPNSELYEIIYNLRMEYTDKGYVTKLSRVINSSLVIIESAQIFEQTCDIALTVKILIEESELKRVLILDLDIIEDIEKKL